MEPSSADKGFFQQHPVLRNQFYDDTSFQRILKLFLPPSLAEQASPELARLGDEVLADQIFSYISDAERNQPYLRGGGRDAFGRPRSELVLSEGWRKLQEFGIRKGIVAFNYDTDYGRFTRLVQFLRLHLWEASCANVTCPSAMHDGAARLLQIHLAKPDLDPTRRRIFQNAFDHLISRDPEMAWTSGQWMTERTGGSDVSQTETVASYAPGPTGMANAKEDIPLGPWEVNGFKWFSSATDSAMAIMLARTKPGKGLSAFFAPMRRHSPSATSVTGQKGGVELNGVRISRLKNKFGTQSLPTAELELAGMRAWLVGEEGRGIQEIATMLTITRVHCAVGALGYLGRGIAIARAYALVREIGASQGRRIPLHRSPLHMRTLAGMTGEYHAMMLLTFYTVYVMGMEEKSGAASGGDSISASSTIARLTPPARLVAPLMRVLSSVHKAYVCKAVVPALYACMEALGGVGYLVNSESEHLNVARLFRDSCVLAIWEGTTDVLSSDALRALKHREFGTQVLEALSWLVSSALGHGSLVAGAEAKAAVAREWKALEARLRRETQEELLPEARDIVFRIAEVLMAVLLLTDTESDGSPEVRLMTHRFLIKRGFVGAGKESGLGEDLDMDSRIVYGRGAGEVDQISGSKL